VNRAAAFLFAGMVPLVLIPAGTGATPPNGSRQFQGTWSAVGRRHTLPTDGGRTAAVVQLSGAVMLTDDRGASVGFQGEAIGFDDGNGVSVGRAVWTDGRGDRVYSALRGEPLETGRRITGTIAGGTGAYAAAAGEYELTWQYIVRGEGELVQGRTADLTGRLRYERQP
jgi:hypothetical protein